MAEEVTVRNMTVDDLDAVAPLLVQLGCDIDRDKVRRRFLAVADAEDHALQVAVADNVIVGFLHLFARPALEKPPEVIIQAMAVDSARRKSGIGRHLIKEAEEWARNRGFRSIALSSQITRADAHAFYTRLGFDTAATSKLLRKAL